MKLVWAITAGLALLYLLVYSAAKIGDQPPAPPPAAREATPQATDPQGLSGIALGDAVGRVDPKAQVKVVAVKPKYLSGNPLAEANPGSPGSQLGSLIEVGAFIDDKEVSRMTYYAIPPNVVQFVKAESKEPR